MAKNYQRKSPATYRYLNRELSWMKFNERVLDQVKRQEGNITTWLKFLHISAASLDEFFMVNVGRLYTHVAHKKRVATGTLSASQPVSRHQIFQAARQAFQQQHVYFQQGIPTLHENADFTLLSDITQLDAGAQAELEDYFKQRILPVLTRTVLDTPHDSFSLMNRALIFCVTIRDLAVSDRRKIVFVQLPQHLMRFYPLKHHARSVLVPVEVIVRQHISLLFKPGTLTSATLLRIIRNEALSLASNNDVDRLGVATVRKRLEKRKKGRIVRLEIAYPHDPWVISYLKRLWGLEVTNVYQVPKKSLLDLTGLQQLVRYCDTVHQPSVPPMAYPLSPQEDLFEVLKQQDILLHHPYNSISLVITLLSKAAEDPHVSAIKITIYRLAKKSAVIRALIRAAQCKKDVVVVMEITARFDEAQNLSAARQLEEAGCRVIYGVHSAKTHAKMMLIVRRENAQIIRYVHLSSGNYNEETAKGYADIGLLTADESYARDVANFFHVIIGRVPAIRYENLITTSFDIRQRLIAMIRQEAHHAQQGRAAGIVIKVNALDDATTIEALYQASQVGVPIQLIVRGICCLRPQKPQFSTNITVRSIVGEFLEHARVFYFHDQGRAKVYVGSADIRDRSFKKRIESLFLIKHHVCKQQVINSLAYDLRDNVNSYLMQNDGTYEKITPGKVVPFNIHRAFFHVAPHKIMDTRLFSYR